MAEFRCSGAELPSPGLQEAASGNARPFEVFRSVIDGRVMTIGGPSIGGPRACPSSIVDLDGVQGVTWTTLASHGGFVTFCRCA